MDFHEFQGLCKSKFSAGQLVNEVEQIERYLSIVEDINFDDDKLFSAVEQNEND